MVLSMVSVEFSDAVGMNVALCDVDECFRCVFWWSCVEGCMVVVSCAMFLYGFCGELWYRCFGCLLVRG